MSVKTKIAKDLQLGPVIHTSNVLPYTTFCVDGHIYATVVDMQSKKNGDK